MDAAGNKAVRFSNVASTMLKEPTNLVEFSQGELSAGGGADAGAGAGAGADSIVIVIMVLLAVVVLALVGFLLYKKFYVGKETASSTTSNTALTNTATTTTEIQML